MPDDLADLRDEFQRILAARNRRADKATPPSPAEPVRVRRLGWWSCFVAWWYAPWRRRKLPQAKARKR